MTLNSPSPCNLPRNLLSLAGMIRRKSGLKLREQPVFYVLKAACALNLSEKWSEHISSFKDSSLNPLSQRCSPLQRCAQGVWAQQRVPGRGSVEERSGATGEAAWGGGGEQQSAQRTQGLPLRSSGLCPAGEMPDNGCRLFQHLLISILFSLSLLLLPLSLGVTIGMQTKSCLQ